MVLKLHVDTNDYRDENETPREALIEPPGGDWSLFNLCLKTFQDWKAVGQTGMWTIDGDPYCGTAYECEINYSGGNGELLLRCLIAKIREVCGDRYLNLWIDEKPVKFTDDDLVLMDPAWIESMK